MTNNVYNMYMRFLFRNSIFMTSLTSISPVLVYRDEGVISGLQLDRDGKRLYWVGQEGEDWFIASLSLDKGLHSYRRILKVPHRILAMALHPSGR